MRADMPLLLGEHPKTALRPYGGEWSRGNMVTHGLSMHFIHPLDMSCQYFISTLNATRRKTPGCQWRRRR